MIIHPSHRNFLGNFKKNTGLTEQLIWMKRERFNNSCTWINKWNCWMFPGPLNKTPTYHGSRGLFYYFFWNNMIASNYKFYCQSNHELWSFVWWTKCSNSCVGKHPSMFVGSSARRWAPAADLWPLTTMRRAGKKREFPCKDQQLFTLTKCLNARGCFADITRVVNAHHKLLNYAKHLLSSYCLPLSHISLCWYTFGKLPDSSPLCVSASLCLCDPLLWLCIWLIYSIALKVTSASLSSAPTPRLPSILWPTCVIQVSRQPMRSANPQPSSALLTGVQTCAGTSPHLQAWRVTEEFFVWHF